MGDEWCCVFLFMPYDFVLFFLYRNHKFQRLMPRFSMFENAFEKQMVLKVTLSELYIFGDIFL